MVLQRGGRGALPHRRYLVADRNGGYSDHALARRYGAQHFLWYTHKGVDSRLLKAVDVVDKVFTASEESMRVETEKKVVTGHGSDLSHFGLREEPSSEAVELLSVGRLSPSKDPLTLLGSLALVRASGAPARLVWAGSALAAADAAYADQVQTRLEGLELAEHVELRGAVPYPRIPDLYQGCQIFVSGSHTGSVDKVVLEAMACGRPAITCNESFRPIFSELGDTADLLQFAPGDAEGLAQRIRGVVALGQTGRRDLGRDLRRIVEQGHEIESLMARLALEMGGGRAS